MPFRSHRRLPQSLPVSSCEQCGETTGLKLITLKERTEWHCFECRRRHAVHSDKNAERQDFLTRPNPSYAKGQTAHA